MNYLLSEAEVPRDVAPMIEITWIVSSVFRSGQEPSSAPPCGGSSDVDSGQPIVVLPGNDGEHR